jgi:HEAT repeat protein
VLIEGLSAEEGAVRLAAALAVRRAGSAGACMPLFDLLERAAEQDRAAIGLALAGPLSRNVDPRVLARIERAVRASSGAERDLLIEAMGRVPGSAAVARLSALAKGGDLFDRAKIAEALAAHADGLPALVTLARDGDGAGRANAVWALGREGTTNEIPLLRDLLRDRDVAAAGNAAASLGRISVRFRVPIANDACPALSDSRSYVRSNALRALRIAGARCPNAPERRALVRDRSEVVREAAAALIRDVSPADVDRRALARCAEDDPSGTVAAACAGSGLLAVNATEPVVVYVVPIGEPGPVARAPFALVFENGLMRLGVADRRGAVFEVQAPRGEVALAVPAPLAE